MSDTRPFTAQDGKGDDAWTSAVVRQAIASFQWQSTIMLSSVTRLKFLDLLDAFAQRLEQEEQQQTAFAATEGAAYAIVPHGAAEALREEGRREILKDVAKLDPMEEDGDMWVCTFCYPGWTEGLENVQHKPDCLWWRAQQARQTPETT